MRAVLGLCVLLAGCRCGPSAEDVQAEAEAELRVNVEAIRQAEIALLVVDDFRACSSRDKAQTQVTPDPHPWESDKCWVKIGWEPDGDVRGAYWVELGEGDFTVHGIADGDGDGKYAEWVANKDAPAKRVSEEGVR